MSGIKHSQRRYHQTSKSHSTKAEVDILGKKIWAKNQLRKAVSKARTVIAGTSPQLDSQSHAPKKQTPASSPKKTPAPSSGTANETPRKSTSQGTKSETATSKKPRSTTVGDLTFELYKDHAVLVKCVNSEATEVEIPGDVENRPMTVIGEHAFKDCTHLSATSIPTSVVELQRSAFEGCTAIKRLELPSDLKVIGPRAFADCSSLEEILLPFELTSIGESAFENCRRLSAIPHFVKQGVGSVARLTPNKEENLPIAVSTIGARAFKNCQNMEHFAVPFRVTTVEESTFEGCSGLKEVWLHSNLESIEENAFSGCSNLPRIRIAGHTSFNGEKIFESATVILTEGNSSAFEDAEKLSLQIDVVEEVSDLDIDSAFDSHSPLTVNEFVDSDTFDSAFTRQYDIRPVNAKRPTHTESDTSTDATPSRFELRDGVYYETTESKSRSHSRENEVTISMTGDLMCTAAQQRSEFQGGVFDFTPSFEHVSDIFHASDLTVGNLETMVSRSTTLMATTRFTDDRGHFNAPRGFLTALRNAGFDVVTNAQNHMYDTGATGMFETLAAMNDAQLLHTGMFASKTDPRTLVVEVNGIKIGIVAYLDPARQKNKQANLTQSALDVLSNHYDADKIARDISDTRKLGAEFVIAFCHWGREYSRFISDVQNNYARMVADAGADYIFGSHSHCPQHYDIIPTEDGRKVPVIYSGGNFLSSNNLKPPITTDSLIGQLTLARDTNGHVTIKREEFIPCKILQSKQFQGFTRTVPCELLKHGVENYDPLKAAEDIQRIQWTMGKQYPMKRLVKDQTVNNR